MSEPSATSGFRISLRELLLFSASTAFGCAALLYANSWWETTTKTIALTALIAGAIVALIDRGRRQVFAIGFVVAVVIYAVVLFVDLKLLNSFSGTFLPARLLSQLYETAEETVYMDVKLDVTSRRGLSREQLPAGARVLRLGEGYSPDSLSTGQLFTRRTRPLREDFMAVGHCLWALLFGYMGGHFGCHIHARRLREQGLAAS